MIFRNLLIEVREFGNFFIVNVKLLDFVNIKEGK